MANARSDIKTALATALSGVGTVVKGRFNVTASTQFPLVFVWMIREDTSTDTLSAPRHQLRTMTVAIDYMAKAATSGALEDAFDEKSETIRAALAADPTLGGKCRDLLLTSTEYMYDGDEDAPFGVARLTYIAKYFSTTN